MKPVLSLAVLLLATSLWPHYPGFNSVAWAAAQDPPATERADNTTGSPASANVPIPGPLRSFLRMAAISPKASPEDVLPSLARNVVVEGYHYSQDQASKPTEYMILLKGYLQQARELEALAGEAGVIRVSNCTQVQPLLKILGYRLRQTCGPEAVLETADPERAFLTIDSAFPLVELEQALRRGQPFAYPYKSSEIPVLFGASIWSGGGKDTVGAILDNPPLARLYWALSHLDGQTRSFLRQSPGLDKLVPLAPVLDFYGSHLRVRAGRVAVPGGAKAESAWKSLVGASPDSPAEFVLRLLQTDGGWLAVYFDALSWPSQTLQSYLTEPARLKRFYEAWRGKDISASPARPVFRPTPNLLLLITRLHLEPDGQPLVPGNLEVWKEILRRSSNTKLMREWAKRAGGWNKPEQLLEALFALSRIPSREGPLPIYLTLTEIDRRRSPEHRLSPQTVRLLAEKFSRYKNQYLIFSEGTRLDDDAITRFIRISETIDGIPDQLVRANARGMFQATTGLWQVLARQREIPDEYLNDSWKRILQPFGSAQSSEQVFDAARASLLELWRASAGNLAFSQEELILTLAGPTPTDTAGEQDRQGLANRILSTLDVQRLISLDTLFQLADGLQEMAQGKAASEPLIRLAGQLREFEMPQPIFTPRERSEWASGLHNNPHATLQTRTDLTKVLNRAEKSPQELTEARGLLTPFLRDTLVGLNYAYYEPPGAQMLRNNPLFVRSHDFSGQMTAEGEEAWQTPRMYGRGWTASGGAHLVGSLAELPYALAQVEQDFIVPENTQSLIWEDLVPSLLTSAVVPRWWSVSATELRAVALYQHFGEDLIKAAAKDKPLLQKVVEILSDRLLPRRLEQLEQALEAGQDKAALDLLMPAESSILAVEFQRRYPAEVLLWGDAGRELERLAQSHPNEVSWQRISEDFGIPHPSLAQTYARELLLPKPLPTLLGYSSRLLAESWESSNLYWARLAEEQGNVPASLHSLIPTLTHRMVEKIFATHLEDWPAVLSAMRETGEEFRQGKIASLTRMATASGP